jgi:hypothetical protein
MIEHAHSEMDLSDRLVMLRPGLPEPLLEDEGFNRRIAERAPVRVEVVWDHRRLEGQAGELRDLSATGLFLRPSGGTVRFRPDDLIWGAVQIGEQQRVFSGTVRWRGWSIEHRCVGLGIEFEPGCRFTEEELTTLRWPRGQDGRPQLQVIRGG